MTIPSPSENGPDAPECGAAFAAALLGWYAGEQRDLPWRRTRDPYAIWVSEMMLQQTQVATVIPFWTRWMQRFPTVRALAEADLSDVLKQWQGLGYYARARNLHKAARAVVEQHGGVFPDRFDEVLALPGIGRYTAGAICSIAFGQDVPLVDANVVRVLCRVFEVRGDPKTPAVQARLWQIAGAVLPAGQARPFNQALMELGALVCKPAAPRCCACPVRDLCAGFRNGAPAALPEFAPRVPFTQQTDVAAILRHPSGDGRLLLVQRAEDGLWGGLWEFPRVTLAEGETAEAGAERALHEIVGVHAGAAAAAGGGAAEVGRIKHGVTTRRITLIAIACTAAAAAAAAPNPVARGCAAWRWVAPDDLEAYPLSSPQVRLAAQVRTPRAQPALF